jgi:cyanate permease
VWTRNVTLWFDRGRGLALGFALAGSGVTAMLAPPIINHVIDRWGWQGGYLAIAAFVGLVALPVIALLYKDRPDVKVHPSAAQPTPAVEGLSMAEALRAPAFWKIALGFFFVSAVIAGLIINLIPLLVDRGLDRANAAQVAGVMGTAVLLGRIGIGWLLDRVSAPLVAGALLLLCGLGFLLLTREHLPMPVIWFCVIALGFGAAAEVDLVAYLTGRYLGMKAYGRIYGLQLTFFYIGAAIGPALIGKAYDHYQDYNPSLYFAVGALAFGAAVLSLLGRPAFARAGH